MLFRIERGVERLHLVLHALRTITLKAVSNITVVGLTTPAGMVQELLNPTTSLNLRLQLVLIHIRSIRRLRALAAAVMVTSGVILIHTPTIPLQHLQAVATGSTIFNSTQARLSVLICTILVPQPIELQQLLEVEPTKEARIPWEERNADDMIHMVEGRG